jgi:hypothetical protein
VLVMKVFAWFGLLLMCWQLFNALRFQEIRWRGSGRTTRRCEQPALFWLAIAANLPIVGVFLAIVMFAH